MKLPKISHLYWSPIHCLFLLCLSFNASAQSEHFSATDLHSYLIRAQSTNPQLKAFEARYEAAAKRIPQLSSLPDPMFQVTHFVESVQTRTGPQENVFMLSQRIPWFGKLSSRESMATADAEALWFTYQNQQLMLARTVSIHYYEYSFTGQAIDLTQENLVLLENLEPIVEEKVKAGGSLNSLLRLKVEIGKMNDKLQSLKQRRIARSAQLNELLNLPPELILPWPTWEEPAIESLNGLALSQSIQANNPELEMLKRKINSAEARKEIARLESSPDFNLGFNYIQTGDPVVNPLTPDAGRDPWALTFAVNIPIWGEKNTAGRDEALATKRATENEYQHRLNSLKAELSISISQLEDANRRLKLYGEELLGLAQQAVENSQSSYRGGQTGILEVIDSERSLLELQLLHRRAATDAWQQRITIQSLANQPILETFKATQSHE